MKKITFQEQLRQLENKIKNSYEEGVTLDEAEKLAAEFLHAQLIVSAELKKNSLDARMRKAGVKAVRAAVYLSEAGKAEKKPSDVMLNALVDTNELVSTEENAHFQAEETRDELERYYNVFREAHIFFRGVSKGKFE